MTDGTGTSSLLKVAYYVGLFSTNISCILLLFKIILELVVCCDIQKTKKFSVLWLTLPSCRLKIALVWYYRLPLNKVETPQNFFLASCDYRMLEKIYTNLSLVF